MQPAQCEKAGAPLPVRQSEGITLMAVGNAGHDGVVLTFLRGAAESIQTGFCRQQYLGFAQITGRAEFFRAAMPVLFEGTDGFVVVENKRQPSQLAYFYHKIPGGYLFIHIAIAGITQNTADRLVWHRTAAAQK